VILIGTITGVLWRSTNIFFLDKSDFVKQLTNKLSLSTSKLALDRMTSYKEKLGLFVGTRESLKSVSQQYNSVLFSQFSEFVSVTSLKGSSIGWVPTWSEISPAAGWPQGYVNFLIKDIDFTSLKSNEMFLRSLSGPNGEFLVGMYFKVLLQASDSGLRKGDETVIFGVIPIDALQDIVADYKGDLNTVFLVSKNGNLFAHPDESNLGADFDANPVVQDIARNARTNGTGIYNPKKENEMLASFTVVPNSNVYVVATTPMKEAFQAANDLMLMVIIFGSGFLFIGLSLAFFAANRITQPLNKLRFSAAQIGQGDFSKEVDVDSNDEVGELARSIENMRTSLKERDELLDNQKQALIQSEKMGAFGQLSAGIAHEVKNPLAGILGHAQLAKGKVEKDDVKKHLEVIEKETRRTKEIIENLMKFARAEKADLIPTDLRETVSATIDLVDHQLGLMGVTIHKKLDPVAPINANANQLQQVFLNIMMNAGHAMEKAEKKDLTVYTEAVDGYSRVRIQDSGSGIPNDIKEKIFEPFFTTKPAGKGTGLGLSVSFGIIRDHKGKIYIESEMGKGTTFFIDLPATSADIIESSEKEKPQSVAKAEAPEPQPELQSEPQPEPQPSVEVKQQESGTEVRETVEESLEIKKKKEDNSQEGRSVETKPSSSPDGKFKVKIRTPKIKA
jgi:signal transduction histidine kinase